MKTEILQVLDDLLKIQSISSDIKQLENAVTYIESYFKDIDGCHIDILRWNKKPSIIVKNFEGKKADIILNGHVDVVPPSEDGQFEPKEEDGKIYARGSGDMKAGDAIMMVLMKEILESKSDTKKVMLIITTDEELGGPDGAAQVVELGYSASEGVLVPDSGSSEEIVIAEKGMLDFKVHFGGLSCHASRPWLGDNAIENAIHALNELRLKFQDPKLYSSDDHWGTSVSMTQIESGTATNVVPNKAIVSFDIRFTEKYEKQDLVRRISEIIEKHNGTIISQIEGDLAHTPLESDFVQSYINSYKSVMGHEPIVSREHGASDGRFFAAKGMPLLLHRPTCDNIHSRNEWVEIDSIIEIYDIYKHFIFEN